jgi:hypothetical protein
MHDKITRWSARRSGPSMTVKGKDDAGMANVTLTDVRLIELRGRVVVAVQADGAEHILSTSH